MLKKFTWIAALLAALAMVFAGCSNLGELGDPAEKALPNPIVDGAKYLEISKRVNGWDSLDIRAGKAKNLDKFTEDATHTITIYGKTVANAGNIYLGNTDTDYSTNWGYTSVKADGSFIIEAKVPWAQIAKASNNKRISIPTPPASYFLYEVVINDGAEDIYKLSEDKEIQDLANGAEPFPDDTVILGWWVKAGTPTIKVVEAGASDPIDVSFDPDNGGKVDKKKVIPGAKLGVLPKTPEKAGYAFIGWYDAATMLDEYTSDTAVIVAEDATSFALKAKWAAAEKGDVVVLSKTILHVQPSLIANTTTDGWPLLGTVTAGVATYDEQTSDYTGGRTRYEFPAAVTSDFNVVELTLQSDIDFEITIKSIGNANGLQDGDVPRYPPGAGNAFLSLKAGTPLVFSVAIEDLGGQGGIAFERRLKGGEATLSVVKAVFSKEAEFTVTFDKSAPIKFTDVPTQTILAGKKATRPNTSHSGWIINSGVNVYDFLGWYLDGKPFDFENTLVEKDIDLVSKWAVVINRTVTFDLTDLTISTTPFNTVQVIPTVLDANPAINTITFPTIATGIPTGSAFGGWFDVSVDPPVMYYNGLTSTVASGDITKDVTLKALFTTTFEVALGTGITSAVDNTGKSSAFTAHPTDSFASGNLSLVFDTTSRAIAFIPLTADQIALVKKAISISIKLTLGGNTTATFRYGLADKTLGGSWNGTDVTGSFGFHAITTPETIIPPFTYLSGGKPGPVSSFFFQIGDSQPAETVVIQKIEISLVVQ